MSCDVGVEIRFVRLMHALLDNDAGGFVDEDERVVLEEDVERRRHELASALIVGRARASVPRFRDHHGMS